MATVLYLCDMYIQTNKSKGKNGKIYTATFLCEKYREDGKVKTKVLRNLSKLPEEILTTIKNQLKHKRGELVHVKDMLVSKSIDYGLVYLILFLIKKLRIGEALQKTVPELAPRLLLMIIGKIVTRGSKLGIYNWINRYPEIAEKIGIDLRTLKVDDLYQALGASSFYQNKIERKWFLYQKGRSQEIFLYDITSTYFEGVQNALAAFGYNRDKKKGKMQIVIGLITDKNGFPLTVKVFEGNVKDETTVVGQLQELKKDFGAEHLTFVGDRGMKIRYNLDQMTDTEKAGIDYITALERPEIERMLKNKEIQLSLFGKELAEVTTPSGRYVLSENPDLKEREQKYLNDMHHLCELRLLEIKESWQKRREQNLNNIQRLEEGHKNKKLVTKFSKEKLDRYTVRCGAVLQKCKMQKYYTINITNESFEIVFDNQKFDQDIILAGKYIVTTNISEEKMDKKQIRGHYRNLSEIEHAFRDFKSDNIQVRPVYHRNEHQTRGHILMSMFSYAIIKEMETKIFPFLKNINSKRKRQIAFADILQELNDIKISKINIPNTRQIIKTTELNELQKQTLDLFGITKSQIDMKI